VLHDSGVPLKLHRKDASLKDKYREGKPETRFVRSYVTYISELGGVALFWHVYKTVQCDMYSETKDEADETHTEFV
jgi:hypothetical protein